MSAVVRSFKASQLQQKQHLQLYQARVCHAT
jgi:hypothetical protein